MDREPRPAPFPVGTRLRYIGDLKLNRSEDPASMTFGAGVEGTVSEVRPGRRGTLRDISDPEVDSEPIIDTTRDGYSVVALEGTYNRAVYPNDPDWGIVSDAKD